jgi:hypothetical protein
LISITDINQAGHLLLSVIPQSRIHTPAISDYPMINLSSSILLKRLSGNQKQHFKYQWQKKKKHEVISVSSVCFFYFSLA